MNSRKRRRFRAGTERARVGVLLTLALNGRGSHRTSALRSRKHGASAGRFVVVIYATVPARWQGRSPRGVAFAFEPARSSRHLLRPHGPSGMNRLVVRWLPRVRVLHPLARSALRRQNLREEPSALAVHAGICAGAVSNCDLSNRSVIYLHALSRTAPAEQAPARVPDAHVGTASASKSPSGTTSQLACAREQDQRRRASPRRHFLSGRQRDSP